MLTKIKSIFTVNRLVALAAFIGSVVAALAALKTNFAPGSPADEAIAKAIAFLGSVVAGIAVVLKFMSGSQNWDSLQVAGVPKVPGATVVHGDDITHQHVLPPGPQIPSVQSPVTMHGGSGAPPQSGTEAPPAPSPQTVTDAQRAKGFEIK